MVIHNVCVSRAPSTPLLVFYLTHSIYFLSFFFYHLFFPFQLLFFQSTYLSIYISFFFSLSFSTYYFTLSTFSTLYCKILTYAANTSITLPFLPYPPPLYTSLHYPSLPIPLPLSLSPLIPLLYPFRSLPIFHPMPSHIPYILPSLHLLSYLNLPIYLIHFSPPIFHPMHSRLLRAPPDPFRPVLLPSGVKVRLARYLHAPPCWNSQHVYVCTGGFN